MNTPQSQTYILPCDHCHGRIDSIPNGPTSFLWRCPRCCCLWDPHMVLLKKGAFCPVHGNPEAHSSGGLQTSIFDRSEPRP